MQRAEDRQQRVVGLLRFADTIDEEVVLIYVDLDARGSSIEF
jgi:hypothetical protein